MRLEIDSSCRSVKRYSPASLAGSAAFRRADSLRDVAPFKSHSRRNSQKRPSKRTTGIEFQKELAPSRLRLNHPFQRSELRTQVPLRMSFRTEQRRVLTPIAPTLARKRGMPRRSSATECAGA